MTKQQSDRYFQAAGCSIEFSLIEGPHAREFFLVCRPIDISASALKQAEAIYSAVEEFLTANGSDGTAIVTETVFFRDIRSDLVVVREARSKILGNDTKHRPAVTEIGQPPVSQGSHIEILVHAIIPEKAFAADAITGSSNDCACDECARISALGVKLGQESRLYAGNIFGAGSDAYEQTHAMFENAESLLRKSGMAFDDVMRTWIYFPEMERDYDGFNRARREFFQSRGVDPIPASTGIGAGISAAQHDLSLGVYACAGAAPTARSVMKTPTLNEAPEYGSDFSRGMRVEERNRTSLYISGTASLDESGKTVHLGDAAQQADRMLVNVAALLEQQGARFSDIAYAITYIKDNQDIPILRQKFSEAGYDGFPNIIVKAPVCRPELLCETEALAVLQRL